MCLICNVKKRECDVIKLRYCRYLLEHVLYCSKDDWVNLSFRLYNKWIDMHAFGKIFFVCLFTCLFCFVCLFVFCFCFCLCYLFIFVLFCCVHIFYLHCTAVWPKFHTADAYTNFGTQIYNMYNVYMCIRLWKKNKNDDDETFTYCINLEFSNVINK